MARHPRRGFINVATQYDVPGEHLVGALANTLKSDDAISPPDWSNFVKTAVHKEKSPTQPDWWYYRTASVLRKIGVNGPIGTERLAKHYSGARDRGSKPNRSLGGSRKILRSTMTTTTTTTAAAAAAAATTATTTTITTTTAS